MECSEILAELENNTGKFPRQALEKAIEENVAITPFLLRILSESKDKLEDLYDDSDYILHLYALYLLAQFREQKAYPLIIEFFSVPGDISLDITGDVVTEDLGRILASVNHGDIELTKKLIENSQVNEYIRSAAVASLVISVVQGIIKREEVVKCLSEIFSNLFASKSSAIEVEEEPLYIWTNLTLNSCIIAPVELRQYIERVFDEDLIEPFFFDRDFFDDMLQNGWEANLNEVRDNPGYSLIEDTISEMESWICFDTNQPAKTKSILKEVNGFSSSPKKNNNKAKKKKKMQKESRRKNRSKK